MGKKISALGLPGKVTGLDLGALQALVRRVARRYAQKYRGLVDPADLLAAVMLRAVEVERSFEPLADGPSFEGYAWKALCGAAEELAGKETREQQKARRAAFAVLPIQAEGSSDDARGRMHDFLHTIAFAGALGIIAASSATSAGPTGLEPLESWLYRSMARLDPRTQSVLRLRFWGDLTIAETAKGLGVSPITVRREEKAGLLRLARMRRDGTPPATVEAEGVKVS